MLNIHQLNLQFCTYTCTPAALISASIECAHSKPEMLALVPLTRAHSFINAWNQVIERIRVKRGYHTLIKAKEGCPSLPTQSQCQSACIEMSFNFLSINRCCKVYCQIKEDRSRIASSPAGAQQGKKLNY